MENRVNVKKDFRARIAKYLQKRPNAILRKSIFILFFLYMENNTPLPVIKFWAKDRYFSEVNEKRIGRASYLLRNISIIVMCTLLSVVISMILMNIWMFGLLVMPLVVTLLSIMLMFSLPILVKKRCHDFGNNGKIASYIILASLVLNFIVNTISMIAIYTRNISLMMGNNMLMQIVSYLSLWLAIGSLVVFLFLLFRPGTIWANQYGELIK